VITAGFISKSPHCTLCSEIFLVIDPITALGLASSIVTFVDFPSKLVSGAAELYRSSSGSITTNIHIENVVNHLQEVIDDLDTSNLGNSREIKRLKRLASYCHELSEKLLDMLRRLRLGGGGNRSWKSLVVRCR
jgi:hypothetical protein